VLRVSRGFQLEEFSMFSLPFGPRSAFSAVLTALRAVCLSSLVGSSHAAAAEGALDPLPSSPGEPSIARGGTLELSAYVRAVLQSNPSLPAGEQGVRGALARVAQAGALDDPMLELAAAPLSVGSSEAPLGVEASLRQKLPWFGKRALERSMRSAEAAAHRSDQEWLKRELGFSAVLLYAQYFAATRAVETHAAHLELLRAMRDAAVARVSSGGGSAEEALQAEGELADLERDAAVSTSQRDVSVAQMNELLHRAPELPLPPPPEELVVVDEPSARSPAGAAIEARPDLVALARRADAERARAERAERDAYPDVTVALSYGSMWDMPQHRFMIGVGFDLPLQTRRRNGAADEARAMRSQLELETERLRDTARTQIFVARKRIEESKQVLALFDTRLLPIARARVDAARGRFISSHSPIGGVLEAERELRRLELDQQLARADYLLRKAELDRALGRVPAIDWKEGEP
jgi:outer membrane protein TolC